jgi:hypothetical protein
MADHGAGRKVERGRVSSMDKNDESGMQIRNQISKVSAHRIHVWYIYIYMVAFTINIPQMLAYIAYMDPMGCLLVLRISGYRIPNNR